MFFHDFKYALKVLFKNKMLLFWTFAFPILLGIFFHMAFSDIEKNETLDIISIAVIENDSFYKNEMFKEAFNTLGDKKNKNQLFDVSYVSLKKAKQLLNEKEITGYLEFDKEDVHIIINQNGINETILKVVVDEISSQKEMIENLVKEEIEGKISEGNYSINSLDIYQKVVDTVNTNAVNIKDISNKNLSYTMIEYYTLIAMACLYGGMLSMFITNFKLANMHPVGKRISVSGIKKGKMLLGTFLASYVVQLIGIFILFLFTLLILKVDYGSNILYVVLLAAIGSLAGLSLGVAIATLIKTNENAKTGILISITMLGCFLSGMMGITMKYIIDKNIPFINKINPANMITDGFYALYYYDTKTRYIFNLLSLIVFTILMLLLSLKGLRRQKYDSI